MRSFRLGLMAIAWLLVAAGSAARVGQPAPDFSLPDVSNAQVKLSDFRGDRNLVLVFYVNHN